MKFLYVTTISNTINAFLIPHIKMLISQGHQVDVAFNIKQEVKPEIAQMGCGIHPIEFQRSPFNIDNYLAYRKLKKLIQIEKYDIIHTHTPVASACVRLACRKNKNIKVIYTAHGFHFYKGAPLIYWLIYYPIEKWLSRYTDILITINKEDYNRALMSFKADRVEYIPGVGIDIDVFSKVDIDKSAKRNELGLPEDAFVLLSVGELNKNKNHEVIIRALSKLNNPNAHYVICGQGQLEYYLKELINHLGLEKQVHLLGYRRDIIEICKASDLFVFPSYREGLSVALMEAMATGLPIVCSKIRGNTDLIKDGNGGYIVEPDDVNGYRKAIGKLYNSKKNIVKYGGNNVKSISTYSINHVLEKMKLIYSFDKSCGLKEEDEKNEFNC